MHTEKGYFDRLAIAQYVGVALFILLLETKLVSRPMAFLLGPWLICICLFVVSPSQFIVRWRRAIAIAVAASAIGYILTRYFFR